MIYYWVSSEALIYLLFMYAKNQQEDLRPDQLEVLKRIIEEELK